MFSRDEFDHQRFEEMCALAPIGEISAEELHELSSHLSGCAKCRMAHEDYSSIISGTFPQTSHSGELSIHQMGQVEPDKGERERFFAEARRKGFRFSPEVEREHQVVPGTLASAAGAESWYRAALAALVLLLAGAGVLGGYQLGKARYSQTPKPAEQPLLSEKTSQPLAPTAQTDLQANSGLSPKSQFKAAASGVSENDKEIARLEAELRSAEDEKVVLQTGSRSLEDRLQATAQQIQALQSEVEAAKTASQALAGKLEESQRSLAQASADLRNATDGRHQAASAIAAQDARVKELSEMLKDKSEKLERATTLLRANREIRDLMTARNLHIVDVYEVDGKGKTRRTFGRAFYTEGKSLIFYAYDPIGKRVNSDFALQGWGARGAANNVVQSLGIFYVDDQKANRWVLEFNDPKVLSEIDSVFVTIEPPGGSKQPTSERLLYAYLRGSSNHP